MSLDFPLLVRSRNFCFFFCLGGGKGAVFLLCFCPLSREGNSGLHSTPSNYSSFYGRASERTGGREERQIAKFEIDREQRLGR